MTTASHLPATPLLRQVRLRQASAISLSDKRALARAAETGSLTVRAADHLATRVLGLTPCEIWGEDYWGRLA